MSHNHDPLIGLVRELAPVRDTQLRGVVDEDAKQQLALDLIENAAVATKDPVPAPGRQRNLRRVLATATAAVAVMAAVMLGWPVGTPPVVADWTDRPQTLGEEERADFDRWCRSSGLLEQDELVLADKRGRMIVGTYLSDDDQLGRCTRYERADVEDADDPLYAGGQTRTDQPLDTGADRPLAAVRSGDAFSFPPERVGSAQVHGHVSADVAEVVGVLDDGRTFQTKISDGYFHGWWPQECPSLWRPGWWAPDWFRDNDPRVACSPWLDRLDAYDDAGDLIDRWEVEPQDADPDEFAHADHTIPAGPASAADTKAPP